MDEAGYKKRQNAQAVFETMMLALPTMTEDALRGSIAMVVQAARRLGATPAQTQQLVAEEFALWDEYLAIRDAQKGAKS